MQFLTAAVSFIISLVIVPMVRLLSFRLGKVKQPRQDRWHRQPTPTLGGIAIFAAFWGALFVSFIASGSNSVNYLSLLFGSGLAFVVGLIDDLHPLTPPVKLGGQIVAATIIIFFGNQIIKFFPWPIANILLTYLWLIGITNSINLLDNIDGLATGVSIIAAGLLGVFLWRDQNLFLLQVDLALIGALIGFLIYNFPPARIFMGDSGSLFIGFLLASLAVYRRSQASSVLAVFGVPILIFLLPILDTTLVTITRLLRGQSPTQGGTDHTSHRLVSFGLSEVQTLFILYAIALIGGCSAIALEAIDYDTSLVLIPVVLITLSLVTAYLGNLKIVTSTKPASKNISRWITELAYRRKLLEIMLDLALVTSSYYLAYWMSYGLDMTSTSMALFLQSWPVALASAYLMFYLVGVYRGVWRYQGIDDLLRFVGAATGTAIITYLLVLTLYPGQAYSPNVFFLFAVFLILGLSGSRSTFVILDRFYYRQRVAADGDRVLLVGAGDEGEMALRWILRNPEIGYRLVGFVDDDQSLWGRSISSVYILGGSEKINAMIDDKKIEGIILTSTRFSTQPEMQRIIDLCHQKAIWVRYLKFEFELIEAD
jgi:UDP-GlcNAc:undecaprenyl-phosphate/decaprenyl-phosphate GlcNAc-1-phosphate transferase